MNKEQLLKKRTLIFVLCSLLMISGSTTFAWSIFVNPLIEYRGWTLTQVAMVGNVELGIYCIGCWIGGHIKDRIGAKKTLMIGSVLFCAGLALSGLATSPGMMYLTYGCMAGFGVGFIYVVPTFVVGNWYPEKKSLMMATVLALYGGSSAFIAPLFKKLITVIGVINTIYVEALLFFVICMAACVFMEEAPQGWNPFPEKVAAQPISKYNYPLPVAIKSWSMWAHFIAMSIYPGFFLMMNSLLVTYGLARGLSDTASTMIVTVMALSQIAGRIISGKLIERFGWKKVYFGHWMTFVAGILLLIQANGTTAIMLCVVLIGMGFGSCASTNATIGLVQWGSKASSSVFGFCLLGYCPAAILIPRLGLHILESTGSYIPMQLCGLAFTCVGALAAMTIKPLNPAKYGVTAEADATE